MNQYYKTQLGLDALRQRSMDLTARQRRVLLLVGTEDFIQLAEQFRQRIAPNELIQQLLDLGLISGAVTITKKNGNQSLIEVKPIPLKLESSSSLQIPAHQTDQEKSQINIPHSSHINATDLSHIQVLEFHQIQVLMIELLEQYCGLMAKHVIVEIKKSQSIHSLKICQIQWITYLHESRIAPILLKQHLQLINISIQQYIDGGLIH